MGDYRCLFVSEIDKHWPCPSLRMPDLDSALLSGDGGTFITLIHKALVPCLSPHSELKRDVLQALLDYIDSLRLLLLRQIVLLIKVKLWRHLEELEITP